MATATKDKKTTTKKKEAPKAMPFSVILTGGKQYKVSEGQRVTIEKLNGDFKEGDKVIFDTVLLKDDGKEVIIGEPTISGAKVEGRFIENVRDKKIDVIHYRSKSRHFVKRGHRQPHSKVEIVNI